MDVIFRALNSTPWCIKSTLGIFLLWKIADRDVKETFTIPLKTLRKVLQSGKGSLEPSDHQVICSINTIYF